MLIVLVSLVALSCATATAHVNVPTRVARVLALAPMELRARVFQTTGTSRSGVPRVAADPLRSVTPIQFGGDPTGVLDSTAAVLAAVQFCVNVSTIPAHVFADGILDMEGCHVDLAGGEFLISMPVVIPTFTANMQLGGGSLLASPSFPAGKFMVVVGGTQACTAQQGSCNLDFGFPALFLDGNRVAYGAMQINNVMGTVVGPQTYILNFTNYGVQVNGGHEVMIVETWLGETNFDFTFSAAAAPKATAVQINSNDHYMADTIVFSSLVGVEVRGAANYFGGVHVWFPWNAADQFNATAFLVAGSQNRFVGCYVDVSKIVFQSTVNQVFTMGFFLNSYVVLVGNSMDRVQITQNEFQGGSGGNTFQLASAPGSISVVQSLIADNTFTPDAVAQASTATLSLSQNQSTSWAFDFCSVLVFPAITHVTFSVVAEQGFPVLVARPPTGCTVLLESSVAFSGTVSVTADSSAVASANFNKPL